jgi:Arc/MetJ-type ribon-helix-helix transcriptional regulator
MPKETVRYPDALVAGVEAVVAEADAFESKSEFYRFASDFLLSVLDEGHEPTVLGYGDIVADLESTTGHPLAPSAEGDEPPTGPFLDAYIRVRRHLLYDDVEAARAVVAERYDATAREALLLDEVIGRERRTSGPARRPASVPGPVTRAEVDRGGDEDGGLGADSSDATADGSRTDEVPDDGRSDGTRGRSDGMTREADGGSDAARDAEDS